MRKFEKVRDFAIKYDCKEVRLPVRATKYSAGYDFYSPIELTIPAGKSDIIWTNIKADCNPDEFLMLAVTSGMGKRGIILSNGIGVVDKDYYSNESNDGNIGFRLHNLGIEPYTFKVGEKIGQGIFVKYFVAEEDNCTNAIRSGGFGSTDNK